MARLDREVDASLKVTAAQKAAADAALDIAEKANIAAKRQTNAAANAAPQKFIGKDGNYYDTALEASMQRDIGRSVNYTAQVTNSVEAAQAAAVKPIMSQAQIDGGGVVKWIGSINGYWQIVMPTGSPLVGTLGVTGKTKKEVSRVKNKNGTFTVTYDDGSTSIEGTPTEDDNTDKYEVIDGILNFNGTPFSGTYKGKTYENGIVKTASTTTVVSPTKTLIETRVDGKTGNTIGYFSDGSQEILNQGTGPVQSQAFKDAYALLEATFRDYGLESLVPTIKGYMDRDLGPEQATLELRSDPAYIKRFKGNDLRRAAGKNALREDIYLATERAYDETLTSYGQANYFGIDREAKQLKMAQIIGNDISADEFKSRVDLAVARVSNADPTIKKLLKDFYPSINDADLVGYFLSPAEGLPKLTEKVTSAEIGSAFLGQKLDYTQQRSTELAQYGIDRAGALKGAAEIAGVLPEATKLGNIYGETGIKYDQTTGEEEFLKASDAAKRKRNILASRERASFEGSAGNAPGAYSTGYLKKSSTAGLI